LFMFFIKHPKYIYLLSKNDFCHDSLWSRWFLIVILCWSFKDKRGNFTSMGLNLHKTLPMVGSLSTKLLWRPCPTVKIGSLMDKWGFWTSRNNKKINSKPTKLQSEMQEIMRRQKHKSAHCSPYLKLSWQIRNSYMDVWLCEYYCSLL